MRAISRLCSLLIFCCLISQPQPALTTSTYHSFPPTDPTASEKAVALTFDDGPHGTLTPRLLDALKAAGGIKVTFFMMGVKVGLHPDVLQRAHEEGHEIANHAWSHPVLSKIPRSAVSDELQRTTAAIETAIGVKPTTMRPPYGNTNHRLNEFIYRDQQLHVILWSLDTLDWRRPGSEEIVKRVVDNIKPGAVILCHDIHPGTVAAVPRIIEELTKRGYSFHTVADLIQKTTTSTTTSSSGSGGSIHRLRRG